MNAAQDNKSPMMTLPIAKEVPPGAGKFRLPPSDQPFGLANYPKATSRVIIMAKPIIKPMVATSECFSACDSGINSSATT